MIKKFYEFINEEFQKIKSKESLSGYTKEFDIILDEPSSNYSLSSSILLKKKFSDIEDKETLKNLKNINKMNSEERKLFYKKRTKNINPIEIVLNNLQFLKDKQKEIKTLTCEYCKKTPLKIYDINPKELKIEDLRNKRFRFHNTGFNPKDAATVDHKNPISKGGDIFDYDNLAVCCSKCNTIKGNMSWDEWIKKYLNKEYHS